MFKVSLRSLLSHKLRLALTALAIILGVTFVAGTLVLTDTIRNTFEGVLANVDKGVAVQVKGAPPPPGPVSLATRRCRCRRRCWLGCARCPGSPTPSAWWSARGSPC